MTAVGSFEKEQLFNAFLVAIKRPDVFKAERELAEDWLADPENNRYLRPYSRQISTLLYREILPEVVHDMLMEYHDDYVESLSEKELADYHDRLSPRNILAVLA